jgi:hypothetical protein
LLALVVVGSTCGSKRATDPTPTATRIISLEGDMAFGTIAVGYSREATLRISNSGTEALTVTGMTMPAPYSSSWTSGHATGGRDRDGTDDFS